MPGFAKAFVMASVACGAYVLSIAPGAYAAEGAPLGAWRTTNDCFLAAFVLTEDGRARAVYMTGERDENAAWSSIGRPASSNGSRRCFRAECIQIGSQVEDLTPTRSRISALASSPFQGEESESRPLFSSPKKGEVDSPEQNDGESGGGRNSRRLERILL